MIDFVSFGLILDDIVYPDGRTAMGVLGGGGPQTAFGMRLWSDSVGLVAGAGSDLPAEVWDWLHASGIDAAGVRVSAGLPTPRAWQVLEADGRRAQLWRVPRESLAAQLSRAVGYLPAGYRRARGFHFGTHPDAPDLAFAADLRALGGTVSLELFRPANQPLEPAALRALLTAAEVFSATATEARSLVGPGDPPELARRLVASGASRVALRLGREGSLLAESETSRMVRLPAVPVAVVDPVGAGNAYAGGFLVGWVETHDLPEAGLRGAVAASFLVEQVGVPKFHASLRHEAGRRLEQLRPHCEPLAL